MLGEPKNKLDEIAENVRELLSQIELQASARRLLEKKIREAEKDNSILKQHLDAKCCLNDNRCYAEDDEEPFLPADDEATFELARIIGRIEGRFLKVLGNRLFEYNEDELQQYTHEQISEKVQLVYEELRDILAEFDNL